MNQVKLRGVIPSAHLPRSFGGIRPPLPREVTDEADRIDGRGDVVGAHHACALQDRPHGGGEGCLDAIVGRRGRDVFGHRSRGWSGADRPGRAGASAAADDGEQPPEDSPCATVRPRRGSRWSPAWTGSKAARGCARSSCRTRSRDRSTPRRRRLPPPLQRARRGRRAHRRRRRRTAVRPASCADRRACASLPNPPRSRATW